ncbi:MAG: hypothetical protein ACOC3V_05130, partial [bacterium]
MKKLNIENLSAFFETIDKTLIDKIYNNNYFGREKIDLFNNICLKMTYFFFRDDGVKYNKLERSSEYITKGG